MNILGRRSLSSFFKVLLDVTFYTAWLAGGLLAVVAAVVVVSPTTMSSVSLSLPVRFEIAPSAYRIQGAGDSTVDARIEDASGSVKVTGPPPNSIVLTVVAVTGVMAVVLVVLHLLRRISAGWSKAGHSWTRTPGACA